jgi:hypothetical protein
MEIGKGRMKMRKRDMKTISRVILTVSIVILVSMGLMAWGSNTVSQDGQYSVTVIVDVPVTPIMLCSRLTYAGWQAHWQIKWIEGRQVDVITADKRVGKMALQMECVFLDYGVGMNIVASFSDGKRRPKPFVEELRKVVLEMIK